LDDGKRLPYATALKIDRTVERAFHLAVRQRVKGGHGEWEALSPFATAASVPRAAAAAAGKNTAARNAVPAVYTATHGLLLDCDAAQSSKAPPKGPKAKRAAKPSADALAVTSATTTAGKSAATSARVRATKPVLSTERGPKSTKTPDYESATTNTTSKKAVTVSDTAVVVVSSSSDESTSSASSAATASDGDADSADDVAVAAAASSSDETEEEEAEFWALCNLCGTWRTVPEPVDADRTLVCSDLRKSAVVAATAAGSSGKATTPFYACDPARLRKMMRWVRRAAGASDGRKAAKASKPAGKQRGRLRAPNRDDDAAVLSGPEDDDQLAGYDDAAAGKPAAGGIVRRAEDGVRTGFSGAEALVDADAWARAVELASVSRTRNAC
jgi:hypothetical protein